MLSQAIDENAEDKLKDKCGVIGIFLNTEGCSENTEIAADSKTKTKIQSKELLGQNAAKLPITVYMPCNTVGKNLQELLFLIMAK